MDSRASAFGNNLNIKEREIQGTGRGEDPQAKRILGMDLIFRSFGDEQCLGEDQDRVCLV